MIAINKDPYRTTRAECSFIFIIIPFIFFDARTHTILRTYSNFNSHGLSSEVNTRSTSAEQTRRWLTKKWSCSFWHYLVSLTFKNNEPRENSTRAICIIPTALQIARGDSLLTDRWPARTPCNRRARLASRMELVARISPCKTRLSNRTYWRWNGVNLIWFSSRPECLFPLLAYFWWMIPFGWNYRTCLSINISICSSRKVTYI